MKSGLENWSFFDLFNKSSQARVDRGVPKTRLARLEALETRDLLAVSVAFSAAEYAALRAEYAEFDLPAKASDLNIIEINADSLSLNSLEDALDRAASTKKDDLIVVRTNASDNTIRLGANDGEIKVELDSNLFGTTTIVALGEAPLTIDAQGYSRVLSLAVGELNLGRVNLTNGAADEGGCVYNKDALTLVNCVVSSGNAEQGGNVYTSGSLRAFNSAFEANSAGEGIYSSGILELTNCSVKNSSNAGLFNARGTLALNETTVSANDGAGVVNLGVANLFDCAISDNGASGIVNQSVALESGAAFSATLVAERCFIDSNVAQNGAGVYNQAGSLMLTSCEIAKNVASSRGGGVYSERVEGRLNKTTLTNCTIAGNAAGIAGGGVYADEFSCSVNNSIVAMNWSGDLDSNVSGEIASKNNMIGGSPKFVVAPLFNFATGALTNGDALDLRLTKNSGALNVGDGARFDDSATDILGAKRVYGANVDLGAYEYQGTNEKAAASSYVVTTLKDSFDPNDGQTSLREALYWASDAKKTITFDAGLNGTIALNSQLVVSTAITIDGENRITLDGKNKTRLLAIEANATIKGLTLTNGAAPSDGGIIYAVADLTLKNCALTNGACGVDARGGLLYSNATLKATDVSFKKTTVGDALYVEGETTLEKCQIANASGAGVYSTFDLTANNSAIEANKGAGVVNYMGDVALTNVSMQNNDRCGLYNLGFAQLTSSTISGNKDSGVFNQSAELANGATFASSLVAVNCIVKGNEATKGAGVYNRFGRVEAINCVVEGNYATQRGGGVYSESLDKAPNVTTLTNCTVAGNYAGVEGGGVYADSSCSLFLYNSIVAQNLSGDLNSNVAGTVVESVGSFIGGNPGFVVAPLFNNKTGKLSNADKIDLRLASNSAAVDSAENAYATETTDITGAARIYGRSVDPGAYEYRGTGEKAVEPSYVVTTLDDSFNLNDGKTSLREALYWANDKNATITFKDGLKGTIKPTSQLVVSSQITIDGDGRITLDGQAQTRLLLVEAPLTLRGLALLDGAASSEGGVLYARESLTIERCDFKGGSCGEGSYGGLVYASADLNAADSSFVDSKNGVGVYALEDVVLTSCLIENNKAGGLRLAGNATIKDTTINANGADGIVNLFGALNLTNVSISDNAGAGLDNLGEAILTNCSITQNENSGMIVRTQVYDNSCYSSVLKAYNCAIKGNASKGYGGGVLNDGAVLELANCEVSANVAAKDGGGVYNRSVGSAVNKTTLFNCTIAGNYAGAQGGGVFTSANFAFVLYNTIVAKNDSKISNANVEGTPTNVVNCILSGAPGFVVSPVFSAGKLANYDLLDLRLAQNAVAIDSGNDDYIVGTTDLAGNARIFNDVVDIGAYEFQPAGSTRVTSLEDSFDLTDGALTLREALYYAKSGDAITFAADLKGAILLETPLVVTKDVSICGNGAVTISGANVAQILINSANITVSSLILASAKGAESGAAFYNTGKATLENCVVKNCEGLLGGAIYNGGSGELVVLDSSFYSNVATKSGGAAYNAGVLRVQNSTFYENTTDGSGGAICNVGTCVVVGTVLANNEAKEGGAIYSNDALTLVNSTVADNAAASGAGLHLAKGTARIYNAIVAKNQNEDVYDSAKTTAYNSLSSYEFTSGKANLVYDASLPLFADDSNENYRLAEGAQGIDQGDATWARQNGLGKYATDLDGTYRFIGKNVDIGAYESSFDVDYVAQEGNAVELTVEAPKNAKIYWDLSGDGSGEFVQTTDSVWISTKERGFEPGIYVLRSKVLDSKGKVVDEGTTTIQVIDVKPTVDVKRVDYGVELLWAYSVGSNFIGGQDGAFWRLDWGDGTYSDYRSEAFVAAKYYATPEKSTTYDIRLVLVGADGAEETAFLLDRHSVDSVIATTADERQEDEARAPIITCAAAPVPYGPSLPDVAARNAKGSANTETPSSETTSISDENGTRSTSDGVNWIKARKVNPKEKDALQFCAFDSIWEEWIDEEELDF